MCLIYKSATDLILIENFVTAEIEQVTNFRGLKSNRKPKLVIEIGSLNHPLDSIAAAKRENTYGF